MLDSYEKVSLSPSKEALKDALVDFAGNQGFSLVGMTLVSENPGACKTYVNVSNMPAAFVEASASPEDCRRDPMLVHMRARSTPMAYDKDMFFMNGAGDLWDMQAEYGYHSGIGVALRLPEKRHLLVGMDRDQALPKKSGELARVLADLSLLALHTLDAVERLLVPPGNPGPDAVPRLTSRELDILHLAARGEANKSIAVLLRVSDNTVEFHLKNIFRKLDCRNRSAAVAMALQYGMLHRVASALRA